MLHSLRTALFVTMLAVAIVAIGTTTLYASLTTRVEFSRFLETGRDLRNEHTQEVILSIMREGLPNNTAQEAEGVVNESGSAMLESNAGFVLNPVNFRVYTMNNDSQRVDLTKTRAINPAMDLRFEMATDGQIQLYDGNTRVGMVYVDPITEIEMMPAQIEFVQSVNDGIMIGAVLAIIAAIGMTLSLSRRILNPIQALKLAARRMETGDFSQHVTTNTRGEIGELAHAFNAMATSLAQNEALRRNMVSDIAHELRTPLTNLRGYLEAVQDGFIEPDHQTINLLHDEAMLLNRLVQDLQELAQAEAGRLHIVEQAVTLQDVIEQTMAMVTPIAHQKGIQLQQHCDPDLPPARADQRRVAQIMRNLVSNAITYTPEQGCISVRATRSDNQQMLIVTVKDGGYGIAPEHLPHIFERFYRVDSSRNRATGGAGLGLAISKYLVEAQGGTINARNNAEGGACFTFTLPIYPMATATRHDPTLHLSHS